MECAKERIEDPGNDIFDNKENAEVYTTFTMKTNETSSKAENNILVDKQLTQNDKNTDENDNDLDQKQAELENTDPKEVVNNIEATGNKKRKKNKRTGDKRKAQKKKAAKAEAKFAAEKRAELDQTSLEVGVHLQARNFEWNLPANRRQRRHMNKYVEMDLEWALFLLFLQQLGIIEIE